MSKHTLQQKLFIAGTLLMALSVALGAFGAHALKGAISDQRLATFDTAVKYQIIHALGLIVIAAMHRRLHRYILLKFYYMILIGVFLFSGSLYALATSSLWTDMNVNWIGAITPFGGALFILSWIYLAKYGYASVEEHNQKQNGSKPSDNITDHF